MPALVSHVSFAHNLALRHSHAGKSDVFSVYIERDAASHVGSEGAVRILRRAPLVSRNQEFMSS